VSKTIKNSLFLWARKGRINSESTTLQEPPKYILTLDHY
jgi:hypothetical protein